MKMTSNTSENGVSQTDKVEGFTEEELKEIRDTFNLFDLNGDHHIDKTELSTVMRGIGMNPTESDLNEIMSDADFDANNSIEFTEFCRVVAKRKKTKEEEEKALKEAFDRFDFNHDGFIDAKELKYVMKNLGEKLTDEEADEMIKEADVDNDGRIDYEEFCRKLMIVR